MPRSPDNNDDCEEMWKKYPESLRRAIKGVHDNLGHPGHKKLCSFFKAGKAKEQAQEALKWFWRDVCRGQAH